jgi:hypothetical protein
MIPADFGCYDGVYKGWIVVQLETKEEVRSTLPAAH